MRPRTLRRRGPYYHRRRSRWRLNLALALLGAALAGVVVVGMRAGGPAPGPAADTAKQVAAAAPAPPAPAPTAPAALGPTTLAAAASAPSAAGPPRTGRAGALAAGRPPDADRPDGAGARLGVSAVRDATVKERAPGQGALAGAVTQSPAPAEGCKTCGDEVPF